MCANRANQHVIHTLQGLICGLVMSCAEPRQSVEQDCRLCLIFAQDDLVDAKPDTRYADKYKQTQHEVLTQILQARGFEVHVLPIILGFAGSIYKTSVSALSTLGIEGSKAKNWQTGEVFHIGCWSFWARAMFFLAGSLIR